MDNKEDMISSNSLAANSRPTSINYIRVRKMAIKPQSVLLLFLKLKSDATAEKTVGITHLDDPSVYIPSDEDKLLNIQAADEFVKSNHKPAPFYAVSFYRFARARLDELEFSTWSKTKRNSRPLRCFLTIGYSKRK